MKLLTSLAAVSLAAAASCACLFAQDSDHPNFSGTWRLDPQKSQIHSKLQPSDWAIRQVADSIEITEQARGKSEVVKCATNGSNCKAKPEGEAAEVTFYYNGPLLVETDFIGHDKDKVVKKRLKLAEDGKTMEIEVLHISPNAPAEKWVFEKNAEVKQAKQ